MSTKICSKCKIDKYLSDFYHNSSYTTGICAKCKTCKREERKLYRENNKSKILDYISKNKKEKPPKQTQEQRNIVKKENRLKRRNRRAELQKYRMETDPLFKLKRNLSSRIWSIMKGSKSKSTEKLLGASIEIVKLHLESTFKEGMSWDNYGEWHVDHKIPLASAATQEEVEKLFHYTNLQALWAEENMSKGAKIL